MAVDMGCLLPQVSERMRSTVRNNQQYVNPGANFMLLNGMLVEVKNFEIYSKHLHQTQPEPAPASPAS
jgi:hypothetical protein